MGDGVAVKKNLLMRVIPQQGGNGNETQQERESCIFTLLVVALLEPGSSSGRPGCAWILQRSLVRVLFLVFGPLRGECSYGLGDLRQLGKGIHSTQPLLVVERRRATDRGPCWDVAVRAALCSARKSTRLISSHT